MTRPRTLALATAAIVVAAAGAALMRPRAVAEAQFDGEPELIAATFASAWCSSCKILEPTLARVIPDFADSPVAFVRLDFTFGDRLETKRLAERYGIVDHYERNKGATGFTLLIDAGDGEIVDVLTMNFSEEAMRGAIADALAVSASTDDTSGPGAAAPSDAR